MPLLTPQKEPHRETNGCKKALELLNAGKPQDAEPLFRAVAEDKAARVLQTERA